MSGRPDVVTDIRSRTRLAEERAARVDAGCPRTYGGGGAQNSREGVGVQLKLNDIYRVRDTLSRGRNGRILPLTSDMRRDDRAPGDVGK